ncbi:serine hydrolase domain-containing protein [Streptomyces zagrosensis]|uniref:CubicO group peptidase (Beta-lactamase class C family) n=1 Tax=Streptomyces zagrosensis TaxID=1042984 RepID=A0A7W9QDE3_9ACTN|nr:serine hydrolase domain-containing protein [Streptomyces zagrosensis]MBB5937884.1 CubicO group peptidase (beta-lactamase class C family) [Streptomyces zagrosensis]
MNWDRARWQERLDSLRASHQVPGAALAVLVDGEIHELASGVLHRGTGVQVTPDSVFQSGSIAKVYTATLVMQLVDSGELRLESRVIDVLPGFAVADDGVTQSMTIGQLLGHTSGISGDFTHDTGRGADCLARYVQACVTVGQDCPPGSVVSYCSTGYAILGRIVEVVTGQTWDDALRERLLTPLGLEHSMTLPEEALRFQVAMSHLGELGSDPEPAPVWDMLPRSAGPYGRVLVTAADVVRFARMHLDGGTAPDGTRVLSAESAATMRRRVGDCLDTWSFMAAGWGHGWALYDWNGVAGYGHDGAALGQFSYLRVVPGSGVAAALLTNGGGATGFFVDLFQELLGELAGVRMPDVFAPAAQPQPVDVAALAGTYEREGIRMTIDERDGVPRLRLQLTGGMADYSPPIETDLVPVSDTVLAMPGIGPVSAPWLPLVFGTLPNGTPYVYFGMRATPRVA